MLQAREVETWTEFQKLEPGVYFKGKDVTDPDNPVTVWHMVPPCGHPGVLDPGHTVTENPDGTITVDPSIFCKAGGDDHKQDCWHGHLRNGVIA